MDNQEEIDHEFDYKFRLLDYARNILVSDPQAHIINNGKAKFEERVFTLAEKIHEFVRKDLN